MSLDNVPLLIAINVVATLISLACIAVIVLVSRRTVETLRETKNQAVKTVADQIAIQVKEAVDQAATAIKAAADQTAAEIKAVADQAAAEIKAVADQASSEITAAIERQFQKTVSPTPEQPADSPSDEGELVNSEPITPEELEFLIDTETAHQVSIKMGAYIEDWNRTHNDFDTRLQQEVTRAEWDAEARLKEEVKRVEEDADARIREEVSRIRGDTDERIRTETERWKRGNDSQRATRDTFAQLFNLDRDSKLAVVFPTRPSPLENPFDQTAMQDMQAITYIERMLTLAQWPDDHVTLVGTGSKYENNLQNIILEQNIISICSPKSNRFSGRLFRDPKKLGILDCLFLESKQNPREWELLFDGARFLSPSYEQETKLMDDGRLVPEGTLEDYGVIIKADNPWRPANSSTKILATAGIRGIGTWGTARHLRTHAEEMADIVGDNNFAAVVKVTYDNWNIRHTETHSIKLLS